MPFLKRRRLGRSYRRKRLPTDLHIIVNGMPVSLKELNNVVPGITRMGIIDAIKWIPVAMGYSKEPMELTDLQPEFSVMRTDTNEPFSDAYSKACDDLVKTRHAYYRIPEENTAEREAALQEIAKKTAETEDAYKKMSMISKLSS